ncbi:hypothetical protein EJB05_47675 [Eragrostis curvula]|uniref:Uncharacterized protein n=1 Tax=Eragrostis curvula TaxID=38414 RepID=A0A5J9T012_9POAL|nr:hypothetical protein EJB05_47675 [Eragrostis curvula]
MADAAYPDIRAVKGRKAAKTFVKYDHYLLDSSREIFIDDSKPIGEFLKMRAMVATTPCSSVRAGRLVLPGEQYVYRERVSTEYGKKFTRSLLKDLWINEQNDESFSDFDVKNMFASPSGRAKFQNVTQMKRTGVQAKKNYDAALAILTNIYKTGGNGKIPKDIDRLLKLIEKYPLKADLYHIHASLVPLSKRQPSYLKMYEQLKYGNMDDHTREQILLGLPYSDGWRLMIGGNRLLKRIYDFKPKIYEVPDSPQQPNPATFDEQLARAKKRERRKLKDG